MDKVRAKDLPQYQNLKKKHRRIERWFLKKLKDQHKLKQQQKQEIQDPKEIQELKQEIKELKELIVKQAKN